jgi:hypothetical protein
MEVQGEVVEDGLQMDDHSYLALLPDVQPRQQGISRLGSRIGLRTAAAPEGDDRGP